MAIDVLELQLVSALQRLANLQRRAASDRDHEKLLERTLQELEGALEEVRVAQEQLVEGRHRLETAQAEVTKERQRYWRLFDEMPQPYLVTEPNSVITEVNRAAAQLFNVSQRFLVGKAMSVFVCEDRSRFLTEISEMSADGRSGELSFRLRPRERAPLDVVATVGADPSALRWILRTVVVAVPVQH